MIDVRAIAKLSRLELADEKAEQMQAELEEFAEFAKCLDTLATGDDALECGADTRGGKLREDTIAQNEHVNVEEIAAEAHDGYISVPRTVEDGEGT